MPSFSNNNTNFTTDHLEEQQAKSTTDLSVRMAVLDFYIKARKVDSLLRITVLYDLETLRHEKKIISDVELHV